MFRPLLAVAVAAAFTLPQAPAGADYCVFVWSPHLNAWVVVCAPSCSTNLLTGPPVPPVCDRVPRGCDVTIDTTPANPTVALACQPIDTPPSPIDPDPDRIAELGGIGVTR